MRAYPPWAQTIGCAGCHTVNSDAIRQSTPLLFRSRYPLLNREVKFISLEPLRNALSLYTYKRGVALRSLLGAPHKKTAGGKTTYGLVNLDYRMVSCAASLASAGNSTVSMT